MPLKDRLLIPAGEWLFRTRNTVFPIVAITLLVAFPVQPVVHATLDIIIHLVGIALMLLGAGLRAMTVGLVFVRRAGSARRIHAERLFTHGMFAHCRNPLYVGNMLIVAGILVNHGNPLAYIAVGAFFLIAYAAMVAAEERYLLGRFGREYLEYCQRVPRWWFSPSGLRQTLTENRFEWRRVVFIEYPSIALWTVILLVELGADSLVENGLAGSLNRLVIIGCGILLTGAAAASIRFLKRTGRLPRPV